MVGKKITTDKRTTYKKKRKEQPDINGKNDIRTKYKTSAIIIYCRINTSKYWVRSNGNVFPSAPLSQAMLSRFFLILVVVVIVFGRPLIVLLVVASMRRRDEREQEIVERGGKGRGDLALADVKTLIPFIIKHVRPTPTRQIQRNILYIIISFND